MLFLEQKRKRDINSTSFTQPYFARPQSTAGFSFIELLIVVAITAILLVFSITVFSNFRQQRALGEARARVVSQLTTARSQTLLSENASSFGVHFTSTSTTLFSGTTFTEGAPGNKTTALDRLVTVSSINLNGGGNDVVFERLTGETQHYGEIELALARDSSATTTIVIEETGLVGVQ